MTIGMYGKRRETERTGEGKNESGEGKEIRRGGREIKEGKER